VHEINDVLVFQQLEHPVAAEHEKAVLSLVQLHDADVRLSAHFLLPRLQVQALFVVEVPERPTQVETPAVDAVAGTDLRDRPAGLLDPRPLLGQLRLVVVGQRNSTTPPLKESARVTNVGAHEILLKTCCLVVARRVVHHDHDARAAHKVELARRVGHAQRRVHARVRVLQRELHLLRSE